MTHTLIYVLELGKPCNVSIRSCMHKRRSLNMCLCYNLHHTAFSAYFVKFYLFYFVEIVLRKDDSYDSFQSGFRIAPMSSLEVLQTFCFLI